MTVLLFEMFVNAYFKSVYEIEQCKQFKEFLL